LDQWRALGCRLLVGHSRKSFMNDFSTAPFSERDPETLGVSVHLLQKKVDYIRVHEVALHQRVLAAYYAVAGPF